MRAAFGYLEIRERLAREPQARHLLAAEIRGDAIPFVNLRELRGGGATVSLRIAADDHHAPDGARALEGDGPGYLASGLLASGLDERASVDHKQVAAVRIGRENAVRLHQTPGQKLQIHHVLGASEAHKAN